MFRLIAVLAIAACLAYVGAQALGAFASISAQHHARMAQQ